MKRTFFFLLLLLSCSKSEKEPEIDCSTVLCTADIRSIYITVSDASGAAIPLDDFTVTDLDLNEDITPDYTRDEMRTFAAFNIYPLLSDPELDREPGSRRRLQFQGFREGALIAEGDYVAGRDCCHVQLYQGDPDLIVD